MNRNWTYVLVGGLLEIIWVSGIKHSSIWYEWAGTLITITLSFAVLIRATKNLPIGTVYAVFTGIGTAGTVLTEMLLFGEPFHLAKVILVALLLVGVIGLKLITTDDSGTRETKLKGAS
ncbi:DMT family transporter [Brevibacillus laterosporus]|uniref:DMT family transporter n=1 Tax=Brevibacillus laterosporus TaxID=1465 RepID=UPI001EF32776|nr:multidrug efflux SMR transporter [Brevibacillus laterosporus]MCG7316421.1 multidrug efflux SMR transporter [Brevibacillus laterosporus]